MTQLLNAVMQEVDKLPCQEQDILAKLLSEELNWNDSIADTQDELALMAFEALAEYKSNKTKTLEL